MSAEALRTPPTMTLWDAPALSHRHGPDTEKAAAERITPRLGELRAFALAAVRNSTNGRTAREVAAIYQAFSGCSEADAILSIRPRLTELQDAFLIRANGERRDGQRVLVGTTI